MDPFPHPPALQVSLGVIAYNEQANVARLLEALTTQRLSRVEIVELLVVSSGSTDRTNEIVRRWQQRDPRIRLLRQERRLGKAAAINLFLASARSELLVITSADVLPRPETVEQLVLPLADAAVGMVGAHPVPLNDHRPLLGAVVHLMWEMHHRVALRRPKLGEMVALRRTIESLPTRSAVDEATLEALISRRGLSLRYAPRAVVEMQGPRTLAEHLLQRRRINAGHLWLEQSFAYRVSTRDVPQVFVELLRTAEPSPRGVAVALLAVALEGLGRALGYWDLQVVRRNPFIWKIARSTKRLG